MDANAELDLGYWFEPLDDPDAPGYRALNVHVYHTPTGRHFDPDRVAFPTVDASGGLTTMTIVHPWRGRDQLRTAVGDIIIRDHRQKRVEAFTFGGQAALRVFPERTYCRFTSPVPIFRRSPEISLEGSDQGSVIAEEVEGLLARRRAAWRGDDVGFSRRLAAMDPTALCVASLKSLESYFAAMPMGQRGRHYHHVTRSLHRALAFLRAHGVDVTGTPPLEMLL